MALSGTVGSYSEFGYTGGMQSVTIPADGIYKLEVWGAQGGNTKGGLGGFSSGYKEFKKGTVLYICVGGAGQCIWPNNSPSLAKGGYNGGGDSGSHTDYVPRASGGGATHIAAMTGTLKEITAKRLSYIYVVAGGGGGTASNDSPAGSGGGINGGNGLRGGQYTQGTGGTQTAAGVTNNASSFIYYGYNGGFGYGAGTTHVEIKIQGGGGGLYGGGAGNEEGNCGGGGSGYIGGVPSFTYNGITYSPSTSNGQKSGHGYAKITLAALTKIYKLNVDGSVVQTVYLDGVALEQIKFDDVSVFGNP